MSDKCLSMSKELYSYTLSTSLRESPALAALREETATLEMARMQISPDQGQFMAMLVKMLGAKKVVEVGTFTGYSALVLAEATEPDAKIYCCDVSKEWTSIAQRHWQAAGLGDKIDLRLAPATETLADLLTDGEGSFDFAFIDADKSNYDAYYESCLKLLRSGGIIAVECTHESGNSQILHTTTVAGGAYRVPWRVPETGLWIVRAYFVSDDVLAPAETSAVHVTAK